jgi:hypothetical protein
MSINQVSVIKMQDEKESVAFQAGVIFAINKFQERLANGDDLCVIEKEANAMLEKILREQESLLQVKR